MKAKEKEKCRYLRRNEGLSLREIAQKVGVSKCSVSVWVRDIELTEKQKIKLNYRDPANTGWSKRAKGWSEYHRNLRRQYQESGRLKTKENDKEYAFGCALFWAEGDKNKNQIGFCNTDPIMMQFFVNFLKKYFDIRPENITLSVNCYLNNGITLNDIQSYWLNLLDLPITSIRKATIKSKYYDGKKSGKHPYGVCRVRINSTNFVQQLFGSIKEFVNDESDNYLY